MFTISARGSYGVKALLGFAIEYHRGPVQIREISDAYDIPHHYLEQILVKLKQNGIMKSYRGSQGGYMLAKDPSHIKVIDILKSLEGVNVLVNDTGNFSALRNFWESAQKKIEAIFDVTLEELVNDHKRMQQRLNFDI